MAVISGYHVDDYCVEAFRAVVNALLDRLAAEKVTDFRSISPGDLIARIPPKIRNEERSGATRQIPVYRIKAVGSDFDADGNLVWTPETDYLYFEASCSYLLDLTPEEVRFAESDEPCGGVTNYFDARDIGQLKEKYSHLEEDLKGILYRIPGDRLETSP